MKSHTAEGCAAVVIAAAGVTLISWGLWLIWPPLGYVGLGAFALTMGLAGLASYAERNEE